MKLFSTNSNLVFYCILETPELLAILKSTTYKKVDNEKKYNNASFLRKLVLYSCGGNKFTWQYKISISQTWEVLQIFEFSHRQHFHLSYTTWSYYYGVIDITVGRKYRPYELFVFIGPYAYFYFYCECLVSQRKIFKRWNNSSLATNKYTNYW